MSINVSQIKNDFNSVKMENYEQAGNVVAKNFSDAEDLVMQTYTVKEEDDIKRLANDLGIQAKAAFVSLGFAVPEMQEVRILSA